MKAQMFNFSAWVEETEPEALKTKYLQMLKSSGFGVLSETEKHFQPFGYTLLILLSESHFAIHTFPEAGSTYIELSSCIAGPYNAFLSSYSKSNHE